MGDENGAPVKTEKQKEKEAQKKAEKAAKLEKLRLKQQKQEEQKKAKAAKAKAAKEAILTENPMKSVRILAQEDFLQPLGKILGITVLNPYSSNNTETILGILSRICSFSKGAKALVQTYCFQALNTVSKQYSIVKKANEILN